MTSIDFVKIKKIFLQNPLDSNPGQQFLQSGCFNHLAINASVVWDSLIIQVMNEFNKVWNLLVIHRPPTTLGKHTYSVTFVLYSAPVFYYNNHQYFILVSSSFEVFDRSVDIHTSNQTFTFNSIFPAIYLCAEIVTIFGWNTDLCHLHLTTITFSRLTEKHFWCPPIYKSASVTFNNLDT